MSLYKSINQPRRESGAFCEGPHRPSRGPVLLRKAVSPIDSGSIWHRDLSRCPVDESGLGSPRRRSYRLALVQDPMLVQQLFDLQILSGFLTAIVDHLVFHLLTFAQRAQSGPLDRGNVHEHVFATATPGRLDEAIPLRRIEPLHSACRHVTSPGYDPATVAQGRGKTK